MGVLHLMDGPKPSSGAKKEHLVTAMLENYSSNLLEPEILFQSLRHGTPQEYLLEVAAALSSEQLGHEAWILLLVPLKALRKRMMMMRRRISLIYWTTSTLSTINQLACRTSNGGSWGFFFMCPIILALYCL